MSSIERPALIVLPLLLALAPSDAQPGTATASGGLASAQSKDNRTDKAEKAARDWLAIVDAGNGERAYGAASDMFRAVIPRESWTSALAARMEYGPARSRKVHRIDTVALDGKLYQIVRFHTDFERHAGAIERVTLESASHALMVNNYEVD